MTRVLFQEIVISSLAILLAGCSTHHEVLRQQQQAFLESLRGEKLEIELAGNQSREATNPSIRNDSLVWRSLDTSGVQSAPLTEVTALVTRDRFLGGVKGFLLGAVGGTAVALSVWALTAGGSDGDLIQGFANGVIAGTIVLTGGTIAGIAVGHPHVYHLELPVVRIKVPIGRSLTNMDVLYLKDGNIVQGTIIGESGVGEYLDYVAIRTLDGKVQTYYASIIERIEKAIE